MKKQIPFKGLCTALVTPMKEGKVDYFALEKLISFQIEAGVDGVLLLGTTGEASTLTPAEKREIAKMGRALTKGKTKYILGCGANSTKEALQLCQNAVDFEADGILLVTPYYNKGTEEGIIRHFLTLAENIPLPQILYHVPGRTGVHFTLGQIETLSRHENIVGLKEAHPDMDWLQDEMAVAGENLVFYGGNDSLVIPTLSLGGMGLISVISNIFPKETKAILDFYEAGEREKSLAAKNRLLPLMRLFFRETSPAPIKYALSCKGMIENELRLPMTGVSQGLAEKIKDTLAELSS